MKWIIFFFAEKVGVIIHRPLWKAENSDSVWGRKQSSHPGDDQRAFVLPELKDKVKMVVPTGDHWRPEG